MKKYKQFAKTQNIGAIKIISWFLTIEILFQFFNTY